MEKLILRYQRFLLVICICITASLAVKAQVVTLFQGFDNYNGTLPSVPTNWYFRWNTSSSFYTSTNNFGLSSPSYKFGIDKDTMITEGFSTSDTLKFWCKGEGSTFSPNDTLTILWSADSIVWNVLTYLDSILGLFIMYRIVKCSN